VYSWHSAELTSLRDNFTFYVTHLQAKLKFLYTDLYVSN
jgi:hypothetical protein